MAALLTQIVARYAPLYRYTKNVGELPFCKVFPNRFLPVGQEDDIITRLGWLRCGLHLFIEAAWDAANWEPA